MESPKLIEGKRTGASSADASSPGRKDMRSSLLQDLALPSKPHKANHNQVVQLLSNHYKFNINSAGGSRSIHKYAVKFSPELPDNSKINGRLVSKAREQIGEKLPVYLHFGTSLYSVTMVQDDIKANVEWDEQKYEVTIQWAKAIQDNDPEMYSFFKIFFNNIMGRLKFEKVGRRGNFVNPSRAKTMNNLQIWPGFFTALQNLDGGPVIQLDITNKVIRQDSLLSAIQKMNNQGKSQDDIQREYKGMSVATVYGTNKHQYRIEKIDFEKSPQDKFELKKEKKEVTFAEYFKKQYDANVTDMNQPLVVTKDQKTGREIYLVPELCKMTGLTDDHRKDFNLMRDMGKILHKSAEERKSEMAALMNEIQGQEKIKELCDQWKISIGKDPVQVAGQRINGGNILMGANNSFPADCNPNDFDRKIQAPMLKQVPLQKWAIFHGKFNKKEAETFKREIQACIQTFKFQAQPPVTFEIQGNDRQIQAWQDSLRNNLKPDVTAIVLILQGNKNGAPHYEGIKKLLMTERPVPSQVILSNTISRGKNLRSICNKILIQINAKIGGEPWALSDMPLMNKPCMIIGYDVFHKRGKHSQLALCATVSRTGTKYWSKSVEQIQEAQEIVTQLDDILVEALDAFKAHNGIYPAQLVFFRDGVGEGQIHAIMKNEISQIKAALERKAETRELPFAFVMVNKRIKTKLVVNNNGRLGNPQPGTVLDHTVTGKFYDFYMVAQNTRQGVPTPCHYTVLHNSIPGSGPEDIQKLAYRLCYTYYNFSGPIKVPAPIRYADKLAGQTGEFGNISPHARFQSLKGLYFI